MTEIRASYIANTDDIESEHLIKDESDYHRFFTLIPNIIFDSGLSPHAITLYCTLKRVAGDNGKCWMNTKTLAKKCNMSEGSVSNAKQELVEHELIIIKLRTIKATHYHEIIIANIWKSNIAYYSANSIYERADSPVESADSPVERIKNQVNKNPKIHAIKKNKEKQGKPTTLAKKNGDQMNKEECIAASKKALEKSYTNPLIGYAHYPERLRPVVEKMEKLWNFKAPTSPKSKQYAFWIQGCDEVLSACAEFGIDLLDKVSVDWELHKDNNQGCAPFTISSPKSLVSAVLAKAAQLRGGKNVPLWSKPKAKEFYSRLDV